LSAIQHNGFLSSINIATASIDEFFDPASSLDLWYETVEANEEIEFDEPVNDLLMYANSSDLYIEIYLYIESDASTTSQIVYVPQSFTLHVSNLSITSIRVLGASGQEIRWYGMWY
jgi:hypothetical protein